MSVLGHLEPNKVFYYFEEICKIPHGSGNTKGISDYLANFAKERNLKYTQDELGNVIISKEATAGKESSEGIVIQGHMDMVAVHKPELDIDMTKEPLKLMVAGDDIYAEGTSLGGDDGIAIAYALAILDAILVTTGEDAEPDPFITVVCSDSLCSCLSISLESFA